MSDVDRRGPVDLRLIRLVPALRTHLVVVAAIAAIVAVAVVVQAEALANGLTDLVADGEITDGLATLVLLLASIAVVRGAAAAANRMVGRSGNAVDAARCPDRSARPCDGRRRSIGRWTGES